MKSIIAGIDMSDDDPLYRVVLFNHEGQDWKFTWQILNKQELMHFLSNNAIECLNAEVVNGKIRGKTGDLNRFINPVNRPLVILSEISANGEDTLGYKIINYEGNVKNVIIKELLAYCARSTRLGGIPIQNAQYVPATNDQKAHIRNYPGNSFIKEIIVRKRSQQAQPAQVAKSENKKALSKLEELFTPEQINELKLGKQNGVDIRIYGNNKLSADQMNAIRNGLQEGLNAGLYADPRYSVESMRYLRADLRYGIDISYFMNPKYSLEQLSELDSGFLSGVDISKYADPSNTPEQMAEIRMRLEHNIWKEHTTNDEESWK